MNTFGRQYFNYCRIKITASFSFSYNIIDRKNCFSLIFIFSAFLHIFIAMNLLVYNEAIFTRLCNPSMCFPRTTQVRAPSSVTLKGLGILLRFLTLIEWALNNFVILFLELLGLSDIYEIMSSLGKHWHYKKTFIWTGCISRDVLLKCVQQGAARGCEANGRGIAYNIVYFTHSSQINCPWRFYTRRRSSAPPPSTPATIHGFILIPTLIRLLVIKNTLVYVMVI